MQSYYIERLFFVQICHSSTVGKPSAASIDHLDIEGSLIKGISNAGIKSKQQSAFYPHSFLSTQVTMRKTPRLGCLSPQTNQSKWR